MLFIPIVPGWTALTRAAFAVYLPLDALAYVAILSLAYASDTARHRRAEAQTAAALRAESVNSRLAALRSRLNPHFLFNALNSVSVLAAAGKGRETGELVQGLTALLRYVLDERRLLVPVRDELEFVRQYFAVQQTRFGDRLRCTVECEPIAGGALVPQLLLQPLVENAVEHGVASALEGASVSVRATVSAARLHIVVEDDGPGPESSVPSLGIGLSSTRERLAGLYGQDATLSLGRPAGGTTRVEVELPFNAESEHE
jgi:two-component system LytT family sensor kinase